MVQRFTVDRPPWVVYGVEADQRDTAGFEMRKAATVEP